MRDEKDSDKFVYSEMGATPEALCEVIKIIMNHFQMKDDDGERVGFFFVICFLIT